MASDGRWVEDRIHVYWYDQSKTILVISHHKPYTWIDYYGMVNIGADMIEGVPYPVVFLTLWADNVHVPTGNPPTHYQNMERMIRFEFNVMVMTDEKEIQLMRIYAKAAGFNERENYWFAETFEEAIPIAQKQVKRLHNQDADNSS